MIKGLLRALGAILGVAFILLPVQAGDLDRGVWPAWVVVVSFVGFGAALLFYAITGRSTVVSRTYDDNDER